MRRAGALAAGAVLVAALLGGCADDPSYDPTVVASALDANPPAPLDELDVGPASCPDEELTDPLETTCTVTVDGEDIDVEVRLTGTDGDDVTLEATPQVATIPADAAADYVSGQLADEVALAEVTCNGGDPIPALRGRSVTCELVLGASAEEVELVVASPDGTLELAR